MTSLAGGFADILAEQPWAMIESILVTLPSPPKLAGIRLRTEVSATLAHLSAINLSLRDQLTPPGVRQECYVFMTAPVETG